MKKISITAMGVSSLIPFTHFAAKAQPVSHSEDDPVDDFSKLKQALEKEEPLTWVFTGDSITQGSKHTHGYRSYPEIFAERVRGEMNRRRDVVINTGISGNITTNILDDLEWRIFRFKPSVVSLMIGTNDCNNNRIILTQFEANLSRLVHGIKDTGAIPVLHTPNTIDLNKAKSRSSLGEYVKVIGQVALKENIILVDHWSHWSSTSQDIVLGKWMNDPIHPNGEGHIQIAQLMFKKLGIFDPSKPTCMNG